MKNLSNYVHEYKNQIEKGDIVLAYKGLMEYISHLKNHMKSKYPDYLISGNIYYGFMDMTYFSFTPKSLQSRGLKIAIVFIHKKIGFEVWLAGNNKSIQHKYWKIFKEKGWNKYRIQSDIKGVDSIVEHDINSSPDFNNLNELTMQIESKTMVFIKDVVAFLSHS